MNDNRINWYPGHMAKARRVLEEQLSRADLIIEVCDARLPYSSRNPDLIRMIRGKKHILILNKSDLADEDATRRWLAWFRENVGLCAFAVNGNRIQKNRLLSLIENETKDLIEKAAARGVRKTVRAMVIGVPNVGKSTLINKLCNRNKLARTSSTPGKTRLINIFLLNEAFHLVDLPGYGFAKVDKNEKARWGKMMRKAVRKCEGIQRIPKREVLGEG